MQTKKRKQRISFLLCLVLIACLGIATASKVSKPADPNCQKFDQKTKVCLKCCDLYYFDEETGLCQKVSEYCATWDEQTGKCLTCFRGYGEPINGVCSPIPVSDLEKVLKIDLNCKSYNDERVCITCFKGYHLDENNVCVEGDDENCDDHCIDYAYVSSNGKHYKSFRKDCSLVCIECQEGYYLDCDNKCQQYPQGCEEVDETGTCTNCKEDYDFDQNGVCVLVDESQDDNCAEYWWINSKGKWFSQWISGCKKICKKCEEGYYLNSDYQCIKYPPFCVAVNENYECTGCSLGYKLNSDKECVPLITTTPSDHCVSYCYLNDKGNKFKKWVLGCKKVCKECEQGYFLNSDYICIELSQHCLQAEVAGICDKCEQHYEVDDYGNCKPISGGPCDEHCAVYQYSDMKGFGHQKWFKGCKKFCKECDQGYYLTSNHVCIELPQNCVKVDDDGTCTECVEDYETDQYGNCVPVSGGPCDEHCAVYQYFDIEGLGHQKWFKGCKRICKKCDEGYYLTQDHICLKLPSNCLEVDQDGKCTECQEDYEVNEDGECVEIPKDHCAVYQYIDVKGNLNSKWFKGCKKICKYCDAGYSLDNDGTCVLGSDPLCVKTNVDGTCDVCAFRSIRGKLGRCVEVDGQCATWDDKTGHCTSCYGGYRLLKGKCIIA